MSEHIIQNTRRLIEKVAHLYQSGLYKEALPLALECCEQIELHAGKNNPEYVTSLNNIAEIHRAMGNYSEAEPRYIEALEITRKNAGSNNPLYARNLINFAALQYMKGNYEEAASHYKEALEILRRNRIENYPDNANGLNGLAETYRAMGKYSDAESIHLQALAIRREILPEKHYDIGNSLHNLAELYRNIGRYGMAEPLYQEALEIFQKVNPYSYAASLNGLAGLYKSMGKFVKSESIYLKAKEIMCKLGESHPSCATAIHNLAELYRTIGNFKAAMTLCQKALDIRRNILDKHHRDLAASLITSSILYFEEGNSKKALPEMEEALEISINALGHNHPDVATILDNIALLYRAMMLYRKAIDLYHQAQNIYRKTLGEEHPDYALSLLNLAALYLELGNYHEAESLVHESMDIFRKTSGEDHQAFAFCLYNLARLMVPLNRSNEALPLVKHAAAIEDRLIGQIFSLASERQRMAYIRDIQQNFDIYLSLVLQHLSESSVAVNSAFDLVLRRKAIGAEALAAQRDAVLGGRYPELEPKLKDLNTLRTQIAQRTLAGPGNENWATHKKLLTELNAQKEKLEADLSKQIPEMNLARRLRTVNHQEVAKILPKGVTLVEFIRIDVFNFMAIRAKKHKFWKPAHYIAFVMTSEGSDSAQMVDLGEAEPIDGMVAAFRLSITRIEKFPEKHKFGSLPKSVQTIDSKKGHEVRATILDPLLSIIGDCKRLLLAPDGDLVQLPFEVLPLDEGRYLLDDYHISYLSAGRDILRFGVVPSVQSTDSIVAVDPDFDLVEKNTSSRVEVAEPQGRKSRDLDRRTMHFTRLPGTRVEGQGIATILNVEPWTESKVLETKLKAVKSPHILHLATHGFFIENQRYDPNYEQLGIGAIGWKGGGGTSRLSGVRLENPLLRSGLALAGANTWLKGGSLPEEAEDGLLTAEDVLNLDLLNTELAVLSACETGLGEIYTGEGVFGLRRAFIIAGVKTLVMSLWKVSDLATAILMNRFYENAIRNGKRRDESLREAQLYVRNLTVGEIQDTWLTAEIIDKISKGSKKVKRQLQYFSDSPLDHRPFIEPFFWGAFICQGDPSTLDPRKERLLKD